MSIQKVLEMAESFVTLAEEGGTKIAPVPRNEYQEQREKMSDFFDHFTTQMRRLIGEMGNDLHTLKERRFDSKMFKVFGDVYQSLISIFKEIKEDKPYIAAEKLVRFVSDKAKLLESLESFAKQHVETTNVDFGPSKIFKHPEIRSLDQLRALAEGLGDFMEKNPLIVPPGMTAVTVRPPSRMVEAPIFLAGPEDKTKT
jgi:hypothetical protein